VKAVTTQFVTSTGFARFRLAPRRPVLPLSSTVAPDCSAIASLLLGHSESKMTEGQTFLQPPFYALPWPMAAAASFSPLVQPIAPSRAHAYTRL